jgi:hypothetical protein
MDSQNESMFLQISYTTPASLIILQKNPKKTVLLFQNTNFAQNVAEIKISKEKFFVANNLQK